MPINYAINLYSALVEVLMLIAMMVRMKRNTLCFQETPCGIWASQDYLEENSIINVFCDQLFDENDYIREYKNFLKERLKK